MAKGPWLDIALHRLNLLVIVGLSLAAAGCAGGGAAPPADGERAAAPRTSSHGSGWFRPGPVDGYSVEAPPLPAQDLAGNSAAIEGSNVADAPGDALRPHGAAPIDRDLIRRELAEARRQQATTPPVEGPPPSAARPEPPRRLLPGELGLPGALSSRETPSLVRDVFPDFQEVEPYLEGVASWYGPAFHGKETASGEVYNQYGLTAAHPLLPMGTRIIVENQENQRRIYVRVNDRGPYKKGRVVDLSYSAARQLGMLERGTAPVKITVVQWPRDVEPELGLRAYRQFVVQVASYPSQDEAESVMRDVQSRVSWMDFVLDRPGQGNVTVICGPYDSRREAQWIARRLQEQGITSIVRSFRK